MAGGAVGWSSKLQGIVALSTAEAEFIAAVEAGKEIAWMRNLLREFGYPHLHSIHSAHGQPVSYQCLQEPRAPWQDEAPRSSLLLA